MIKRKTTLFTIGFLAFSLMQSVVAGTPAKYSEQSGNISKKTQLLLSEQGYCQIVWKDLLDEYDIAYKKKHQKKCGELILTGLDNDGIRVYIYEYNTLSPSVVNQIIDFVLTEYYQNNKSLNIDLMLYEQTRRNKGFFDKPVINLYLKKQGE